MTDLAFVDSNVILYALDRRDQRKSELAEELLAELAASQLGVISTQIVNEVVSVVLSKYGMGHIEVVEIVESMRSFRTVTHDVEMTLAAVELHEEHAINFWDALIVAAAVSAGCKTLYTEDLSHGHTIAGLRIVDPFA